METENFKHLYNVLNNEIKRIEPMYDRQADYQTNSKSYYDYLAKLKKLFELLSNRIWEYDEELKKRFEEWDKLIEKFPENVEKLLVEWLEDETLSDLVREAINEEVVAARGGSETLGERLDSEKAEINARLAHTWKSLESFPRLTTENNDTGRFKRLIENTNEGETAFIPYQDEWYDVDDTILIDKQISFVSKGKIGYSGVRDRPVFLLNRLTNQVFELFKLADGNNATDDSTLNYGGYHGWEHDDYVGVKTVNLKWCTLKAYEIRNFTKGVKLSAINGGGYWFNYHYFKNLINNRIQLELNSDGDGSWFNSNYFYDTSFAFGTSHSPFLTDTKDKFSIFQTMTNGNQYGGNSNVFKNLKFEVAKEFASGTVQVHLKKATDWFFEYRNEISGNGNKFAEIEINAKPGVTTSRAHSRNVIFSPITMTDDYETNIDFINTNEIFNNYPNIAKVIDYNELETVFEENNIVEKARKIDDNYLVLKGYHFSALNSIEYDDKVFGNYNGSFSKNGVKIHASNPIALNLEGLTKGDTVEFKSTGIDPKAIFKVFGDLNDVIGSEYVNGVKTIAASYNFDSSTSTFSPGKNRGYLKFTINSDNVKKVKILLYGEVESFKIKSNSDTMIINKQAEGFPFERLLTNKKPTVAVDGGFNVGETVYNTNGSTENTGWVLNVVDGLLEWVSF